MTPFLRGFTDELVKLGADETDYKDALREARRDIRSQKGDSTLAHLRGQGAPVSRDYLASMVIGAASVPALSIVGKMIARKIGNRQAAHLLAKTIDPKKRKAILSEMHRGPAIGRAMPGTALNKRPLMTHGDLASDAAKGALGGTVVQMIRDHFSGSGKS